MKREVMAKLEHWREYAEKETHDHPNMEYWHGFYAAFAMAIEIIKKHEPIGDGGEVVAISDILTLAREMTKHVEGLRTTQGENSDGTFTDEQKLNNAIYYAWSEAADWVRWFAEGSACNANVYEAWEPIEVD